MLLFDEGAEYQKRRFEVILLKSSDYLKNKLTSINIPELKQRITRPSVNNLIQLFTLLPVYDFYRILNLLGYTNAFVKLPLICFNYTELHSKCQNKAFILFQQLLSILPSFLLLKDLQMETFIFLKFIFNFFRINLEACCVLKKTLPFFIDFAKVISRNPLVSRNRIEVQGFQKIYH